MVDVSNVKKIFLNKIFKDKVFDKIEVRTIDNLSKIAGFQSTYDEYESCCTNSLDILKYFVVNKTDNGEYKIAEVPYGRYYIEHAANHIPDTRENNDVYVGDYITENTVAIVEYYRAYQDYNENIDECKLIIYVPENNVDRKKIEDEIKNELDKLPLNKLMELYVRLK